MKLSILLLGYMILFFGYHINRVTTEQMGRKLKYYMQKPDKKCNFVSSMSVCERYKQ